MTEIFFFGEDTSLLNAETLKEKLKEFDAPPWSPDIEALSPINTMNTAFCERFETSTETESTISDYEFRSPESDEEFESPESPTCSEEFVEKVSLPPTPKLRVPVSQVLARTRRINFDMPEDDDMEEPKNNEEIDTGEGTAV